MSKELIPTADEVKTLQLMAKNAVESKFFQQLNGEAGILTIALYARELGLPPMQCLFGGMHNIQGKIELSARMINSMIRKAGHKVEIVELNEKKCSIIGTRKDTGETLTVTYTIEDARKAGLIKDRGPWTTYAEDKLFASTISRLGRRLYPDVIGTAYAEGEIKDTFEPSKKESKAIEMESVDMETGEFVIAPEPAVAAIPFEAAEEKPIIYMTRNHVEELEAIISDDTEFLKSVLAFYKKSFLDEVTDDKFEVIKVQALKKKKMKK